MRKVTHRSSQRSKRRSRSYSPRRRHHSYSCSRSLSREPTRVRGCRARDNCSPRESRSVCRSVSPRDERSYKSRENSSKHSPSLSRSVSPHEGMNRRPTRHSLSPGANGHYSHVSSRSRSPIRGPIGSRSQSHSHSPR